MDCKYLQSGVCAALRIYDIGIHMIGIKKKKILKCLPPKFMHFRVTGVWNIFGRKQTKHLRESKNRT